MSDDMLLKVERTLQQLTMDNAQLRAENRRPRKLPVNRGHGRIVAKVLDDATAMLAWRFAGCRISRDTYAELLALRGDSEDDAALFGCSRMTAHRIVKRAAEQAGIRKPVSAHQPIRHSPRPDTK